MRRDESWIRLNEESQLPSLTDNQLETLRRFASFEISVMEMREALIGVFDFSLEGRSAIADGSSIRRSANTHFRVPEPGIAITREHISRALDLKRQDLIAERDLVIWATVLLLNDAYVLDPGDEDLIAEWLNDMSLNLDSE